MRSIATLTLMASTAFAVAGPPATADEPKGDLAKLQGSWTAKVGPEKKLSLTVTIKGKAVELAFTRPDGEVSKTSGNLTIDEMAKPKTYDWAKIVGSPGDDISPILGIYKLEGDSWTTCSGGGGKDRPAEFKDEEDGGPRITTFTRVQEQAAEKPIKGDLAKFQGTWLAPAGPNDEVVITLTVKGNAYTAKWDRGDGTDVELKGELRLNEKATPHKTIDFFKTQRNDGEDARDTLGIYEMEGDKIKVCVGGGGDERPTEFKKGSEGTPHLLILARKKD